MRFRSFYKIYIGLMRLFSPVINKIEIDRWYHAFANFYMIYIALIRLFHDVNQQNLDRKMNLLFSNFYYELRSFDSIASKF
jgi:hypothetical protein